MYAEVPASYLFILLAQLIKKFEYKMKEELKNPIIVFIRMYPYYSLQRIMK
ncbi:hypothetical protein B4144_1810 [Bacillus atrophaeus]|nr:hypothetical protein B4144_1810 [Bacillus atrophaeus]